MKTIYYYQTFVGLQKLLDHIQDIDVIIVSSIHFARDKRNEPHIYLNDNIPDDPLFDTMWMETKEVSDQGKLVMLMIGGAGGAYTELFRDFDTYYPLLKKLLNEKTHILGVDLDIEEFVSLENVKRLIVELKKDFGTDFVITMAPVSESMMTDNSGMGGFSYKELVSSKEGQMIDRFHVQCYESFSFETYHNIIENGYPPEKIVMGMMSGQFDKTNFQNALINVKECIKKYPTMGGVYDWEYLDAPPDENDCSFWAKLMKQCESSPELLQGL
jgi:hypothetical protein